MAAADDAATDTKAAPVEQGVDNAAVMSSDAPADESKGQSRSAMGDWLKDVSFQLSYLLRQVRGQRITCTSGGPSITHLRRKVTVASAGSRSKGRNTRFTGMEGSW